MGTVTPFNKYFGRPGVEDSVSKWLPGALDSRSRGPGSRPGCVIVLCSWASHFNFTVPLSTQEYNWVPANCQGSLMNAGRLPCDVSHPGEGTGG